MNKRDRLTAIAFALSVAALFFEQSNPGPFVRSALHALDAFILALLLWETAIELREAPYATMYLRAHAPALLFLAGFTALFFYTKYRAFFSPAAQDSGPLIGLLRNGFLIAKVAGRFRKLIRLMERFTFRPSQTIAASFLLVILAGTLALMAPAATSDGAGLPFVDAAFTATSAVCVTGLAVADTARDLSFFGQAALLLLIQIGGLGIMAFSFFGMFAFRKKLSVRDRMTVSYMLGDDDMSQLSRGLRDIVLYTLGIEAAGALFLFVRFSAIDGFGAAAAFRAVFHAVSAFCNAGFALFSDSLESFRGDPWITLGVAALIVLGGISFGVIRDLRSWTASAIRRALRRGAAPQAIASVNTRVVLAISSILLLSAFCGFYLLEHRAAMADFGLGEQYLAALFQSVTLRTAGFNSVPMGALRDSTLLFMCLFMFIGGASGSTAGGIKVNSLAAMGAYFNAFVRQERTARIGSSAIAPEKVGKAFLILVLGFFAVFAGTFVLSLTEDAPFLHLLFEAVSAFGTVGLSTGLTPELSDPGKAAIMILMFLGRLGPLTILAAASRRSERGTLEYPYGDLAIG